MAKHFAHVKNGIVDRVCLFDDSVTEVVYPEDPSGEWIETFPNADASKRYNFAGPESIYDSEADAFYPPQPYEGFTLNTSNFTWEAPLPKPSDNGDEEMGKIGGPEAPDVLCVVTYSWDPATNNWRRKLLKKQ